MVTVPSINASELLSTDPIPANAAIGGTYALDLQLFVSMLLPPHPKLLRRCTAG